MNGTLVRLNGDAASRKGVSTGVWVGSGPCGWVDTSRSLPDGPRGGPVDRARGRIYKYGASMASNHRHELGSILLSATLVLAMGACVPMCGIGGKFAVSNARVDPSFSCPNPATRYAYDVHVTMDASNSTSKSVAIKSISETWKNVAVHGKWTGTLGDHGTTKVTTYAPMSLASGSSAT